MVFRSFDTRIVSLDDSLRISVTDRCNFRCTYCMPREVFGRDFPFLPSSECCLRGDHAAVAIFSGQGVEKIRLTGGEPLVRRNVERLVEMLAAGRLHDLTLTTNGSLLRRRRRRSRTRAAAHHSQPRLARRRRLQGDERRRLSRRARARGHRGGARGGSGADQDQHGGQARRERHIRWSRWPATSTARATSCASSSTWTWGDERLADGRCGARGRDSRA